MVKGSLDLELRSQENLSSGSDISWLIRRRRGGESGTKQCQKRMPNDHTQDLC